MPIQYMKDDVPFSLSLGSAYDIKKPIVTMTNRTTGQQTIIDYESLKPGQYMNIERSSFGYLPALIWRPNPQKFHYRAGEQYRVHIDGIFKNGIETPIRYTVSFFDMRQHLSKTPIQEIENYFEWDFWKEKFQDVYKKFKNDLKAR